MISLGGGASTDLSCNTPGCDMLLTPGTATYDTLATLTANGYQNYFDPNSIAVSLLQPQDTDVFRL
jgi:hypothetical protein